MSPGDEQAAPQTKTPVGQYRLHAHGRESYLMSHMATEGYMYHRRVYAQAGVITDLALRVLCQIRQGE